MTEKSAANAKQEKPDAERAESLFRNGGDGFWLRGLAFNEEAARFAARRADRYRTYFAELADCRTPADAFYAASRAAQTCMSDYAEEFARFGELAIADPEDALRRASEDA
mgnify:CR=1 FL=1|jgi:hypothetical protein